MAALLGGNIVIDRHGRLAVLLWDLDTADVPIGAEDTYSGETELSTENYAIASVRCAVESTISTTTDEGVTTEENETTELLAGEDGAYGFSISNPFMTQTILDGIFARLGGKTFRSGKVGFYGHPELDPGDVISVADREGAVHFFPVMDLSWELDGGLRSSAQSFAVSEPDAEVDFSGPTTQAMERMTADLASFKQLYAENIRAQSAVFTNLKTTKATVEQLTAVKADISALAADIIKVDDLAAKKADIDLLNVTTATIENLFIRGGLLTDSITAVELNATKYLTGVTIIGDVIRANTLTADKLILKGTDGLIYELNAQAGGLTSAQLSQSQYQTALSGTILAANSITADKINVTDLFAQSITASGTIKGLTLDAATGSFSGKITAGSGTIGRWTIKSDGLYYTTSHGTVALHPAGSDNVIEVTSTDSDSVARHFYVDSYGIIDATAARIAELSLSYLDGETAGVLSPNSADFGSGIRCSSNLVIEGTHSDSRINRIYMYNGATASPSILQPDFTNLFGVAEGAPSGRGGLGYIEGTRMALSSLTVGATFDDSKLTAQSGYYTTYYLPCKVGDTVRFSGFWPKQNNNTVISFWDASFKLLSRTNGNYFVPNATYNASNAYNVTIDTTAGTWQIVIPSTNHTGTSLASTAYIRVCFSGVAAPRRTFVATCNETITYTKLSHTRWASIALGYENGTSDGFISNLMLHGNGDIDADGSLELGGVITLKGRRIYWNSPVDNGDLALSCKWKDGSNHGILMRGADGLTTTVGWAGNSSYASILNLTSRTVKYTNSSGATSLSDERFKMNWGDLTAYDSFFDALKPQKFQYIDGSSGRYHLGFSAQAVESALTACDLSGADFAGLVRYEVPLEDESWRGYSEEYGLIYTEFVALLVDQVQKLKARVKALEGAA